MTALVRGLRLLTPLGWTVVAVAAVLGIAILAGGLGFRWDPLDLSRRRAERAETLAAAARAEATARAAEAEGQAGQVARLDAALTTARSIDRATDLSTRAARTADDAVLPLSPDRVDRLRDHDCRLCGLAPDLVGCPAASDAAADGEPPV